MCSRLPLIVVLGATGTGKSKLSLQLAQRLSTEVISADSMQVYKGLDVITNKVTEEEMDGVPHHLLGFLEPLARYTVVDFRNKALPIIDNLIKKGKVPIIVGGTNYYIESLLWRVLLEEQRSEDDPEEDILLFEREGCEVADVSGSLELLSDSQRAKLACSHLGRTLRHVQEVFCKAVDNRMVITSRGSQQCERKDSESNLNSDKNSWCLPEMATVQSEVDTILQSLEPGNLTFPGSLLSAALKELDADPELALQRYSSLKESDCFTKFTAGLEDYANRLGSLGDPELAEMVKGLERALNSLESVLMSRVDRVAEAVGLKFGSSLQKLTSHQLHDRLRQLDPEMARSLHPNNRRKIIRSLQVMAQKGRKHSELLKEQRDQEGGSDLGGPLRYPNTVVFWLQCQTEVLNKRLDDRVDDMIQRGLLEELQEFHRVYNRSRLQENPRVPPYTQGIFQSIGFKEFHDYLVLDEEGRSGDEGKRLLEAGVEALKLVTRRYAKQQDKWVRNRFIRQPNRQVPDVFGLDTTNPGNWDKDVLEPAVAVVDRLLGVNLVDSPEAPKPLPRDPNPLPSTTGEYHCQVCDRVFIGALQWEAHLKSKKHQTVLKKKQKLEQKKKVQDNFKN